MNIKNISYKIINLIILILLSFPIMGYVYKTGLIQGADIWGHLYKTDILYHNILDGNFFTLYDEQWYNGIQMFRYWPPLSYYILALFQHLCGGNIEMAYIVLVGFTYVFGGYAWTLFGISENKKIIGTLVSIFYWFFPDNLRIFFCEGNLPRILFVSLVPYLLYFIWKFIHHKKKSYIIAIIIWSIFAVFIHLMMSAIVGIGITLFLFLYFLTTREFKLPFFSMLGIICGYISAGIILLPGLMGGIVSQSSSASISTIADWAQELGISLNPLARIDEPTIYYFGLSILLISIFGIRNAIIKKNKILIPVLLTVILVLVGTSSSLTDIISMLPMSQVWWMQRFTVIASCLFALSFFLFKKEDVKPFVYAIFFMLLTIDIIPSLALMGNITGNTVYETEANNDEKYLFAKAEEITDNRLTILDESLFGSYESFFIKDKKINISTGWALQGAQTYQNIVYLNEALYTNSYSYLFDRMIKLGSDTVIIYKGLIDISELDDLIEMAKNYNYDLVEENDNCLLFKLNGINSKFGVVSNYKNLAIGSSARYLSLIYPSFQNGVSNYIDEYSLDELYKYEKIYLAGDFYKNKEKAELMIRELSNNDVKVFIDINSIKQDFQGYINFLDVRARILTLVNSFPNIIYNDIESQINLNIIDNWNAAYITNNIKTDEYFVYSDQKYSYLRKNDNITYIGMNLIYFYNQNPTDELKSILDQIFDVSSDDEIVKQEIHPIKIHVNHLKNTILIQSDVDNINTTISYQDFFDSDKKIKNEDNLLVVDKGTTIITYSYKYFNEGLVVSCIGVILSIILIIFTFKIYKGVDKNAKFINNNTVL